MLRRCLAALSRTYWLARQVAARIDGSRRYNCHLQDDRAWQLRAVEAARLLGRGLDQEPPSDASLEVGDLGCGNQRLQELLPTVIHRPIAYQGYDLHPQSDRVRFLDVRQGLPDREFDIVFCLGLLEYVSDVEVVVRRLREICQLVVVSYVIIDGDRLTPRERVWRGWNTHCTRQDLEDLFRLAGFGLCESLFIDGGRTAMWLWKAGRNPGPSVPGVRR